MPKVRLLIIVLLASFFLACGGCSLFSPNPNPNISAEQNKLDQARQWFDDSKVLVTFFINAGYLAKNDQPMKDAIFALAKSIDENFDQAQVKLTAGNKIDFQFWFDSAMQSLAIFLNYENQGKQAYRLSNPTTRPTLPKGLHHGSSADIRSGPNDYRGIRSKEAWRSYAGAGTHHRLSREA